MVQKTNPPWAVAINQLSAVLQTHPMLLRIFTVQVLLAVLVLALASQGVVATQLGQICRMQCQQRYSLCQQQMSEYSRKV